MKKILVPLDFSKQSGFALRAACQLVQKWDAAIVLMHVIEFPLHDDTYPVSRIFPEAGAYLTNAREEALELLLEEAQKHQIDGVDFSCRVEIGAPFYNMSKSVSEEQVDLVVMGATGKTGLKEMMLGSNAEKMVRFSGCPVLIIKNEVDLSSVKNIVFATSLERNEQNVIQQLVQLQKLYGAHIYMLRVNTISNFLYDTQVRKGLDNLARQHHLENYSIHTYSDMGEEEGILHFAEEIGADLIALGTHARRGIAHLLKESITENLVNHVDIPILTMKLQE